MDYELAKDLFKTISASRCKNEWRDLIDKAAAYARIRVDWLLAEKEQQSAMGNERTARHDAFIASCQSMANAMTAAGEPADWHARLGADRKTIGDFACFVHCILGQIAR